MGVLTRDLIPRFSKKSHEGIQKFIEFIYGIVAKVHFCYYGNLRELINVYFP